MSKKNIIVLSVTFLAVASVYFYLYRDSFAKPIIQISHTIRPRAAALVRKPAKPNNEEIANNLAFRMGTSYRLTSVKVVCVSEFQTNKYAHPLWELVSESNSIPIQTFAYGMRIRGMQPPEKTSHTEPLVPNTLYRLFVQAGSLKGEHDFTVTDDSRLGQ